jgi:hypothetical protein
MRRGLDNTRYLMRALCAVLLLAAAVPAARADWISRLARIGSEVGEVAPKAGRIGIVDLERAATHIRALPPSSGAALAAHATPEGHWKFVNKNGDVFTAATPEELQRVLPTLLPETPPGSKLGIYLSEDTLFGERALLKDLPPAATLFLVAGKESYPLIARTTTSGEALYAAVRPKLIVELRDRALFNEALVQLERPLSRSSIRTLALEPGSPATLSSYPRLDPDTKTALVDAVDPASLPSAIASVRGQTVLVTGRVEGNLLYFRPSSGPEQSVKLSDLMGPAAAYDVNLVILHAASPRQPGGRNWLWQRISVGGLDDALKRATLGDFLDALGQQRGEFGVSIMREGSGRIAIRAVPTSADDGAIGAVSDLWTNSISSVTGNVVTSAVEVHARDEDRQREIDTRIIPGVPAWMQILYLICLGAGVLAWPVSSAWFQRIWPSEQRAEYGGWVGYRSAQLARLAAFLLLFLPIVGLPALVASFFLQFWSLATLFVRAVRRLFARTEARAS